MRHMDQIHARGIWIVEILNVRYLVVLTTDGQHTSCLSGCGCLNWRHETVSNLKISKNLKFQDFKILDLKAHQVVNLPQPLKSCFQNVPHNVVERLPLLQGQSLEDVCLQSCSVQRGDEGIEFIIEQRIDPFSQ